ncbi:hypothetical protein J7L48_07305, partial [bacterium]|nr:hypothetical protein [bacterium]
MISEISEEKALVLKNIRLKSEELNSLYLSLQKQLIESTISQKTLQAEETQLKENVNDAWKRVEALK